MLVYFEGIGILSAGVGTRLGVDSEVCTSSTWGFRLPVLGRPGVEISPSVCGHNSVKALSFGRRTRRTTPATASNPESEKVATICDAPFRGGEEEANIAVAQSKGDSPGERSRKKAELLDEVYEAVQEELNYEITEEANGDGNPTPHKQMHRVLRDSGTAVITVGRESCVLGVSFKNSQLLAMLAVGGARLRLISWHERRFRNRFGQWIYEDLLTFKPDETLSAESSEDFGRLVGTWALTSARKRAPEQSLSYLEEAIRQADTVEASPVYHSAAVQLKLEVRRI